MASPSPSAGAAAIDPATRLGPVHYTVADLGRQLAFYQERLGFQLHWREGRAAGLGAGAQDLLILTELPGARPARRATGLYHTAFLLPSRLALAQLILKIAVERTPVQGGSNHGSHLALYLDDAEGNGVELAWDFPREVWDPYVATMRAGRMQELLEVMRQPLDVDALLDEAQRAPVAWAGLPAGTQVGHVHLRVVGLDATARFYQRVLGFETLFNLPQMGAAFFSAGGYHHHIGSNIWAGAGQPPAPPEATGLRWFTVVLPAEGELARVAERLERANIAIERADGALLTRDPSGIAVRLVAEG